MRSNRTFLLLCSKNLSFQSTSTPSSLSHLSRNQTGPVLLPPLPGPPPRAPRRHARLQQRRLAPGRPGGPVLSGARRVGGRGHEGGELLFSGFLLCCCRWRCPFFFFFCRGLRRRGCQQLPAKPAGRGHGPHERADERRRRRGRNEIGRSLGKRELQRQRARRRPGPQALRAAAKEGQRGVPVVYAPGTDRCG